MYLIWILVAMPVVALLCAACIAGSDGKCRPPNADDHGTLSTASFARLSKTFDGCDSISDSKVEILIAILGGPSNGQTRVSIRQLIPGGRLGSRGRESRALTKIDAQVWTPYKCTVWSLKHCLESLPIDKDSSPTEARPPSQEAL